MTSTVSSENIFATNKLYEIYKTLPGKSSATYLDFYSFLSINSAKRKLFLDKYCNYTFSEIAHIHILNVVPKNL